MHSITPKKVNKHALNVVNKLQINQFEAFVVGGGVRDLLLQQKPKDFDVGTAAIPKKVRSIFRNSRIIGRRFKIVHVIFGKEIIEVTTFRGQDSSDNDSLKTNDNGMLIRDNIFGTVEEDAWRRDFTINALYYNPTDNTILDFTNGFVDLKNKILRCIGDANVRYPEDPVRMLRVIRFAAKLDFTIEEYTAKALYNLAHLINNVSSSRLFEEVIKIYHCGNAVTAHAKLLEYGIFKQLFPETYTLIKDEKYFSELITLALENTDARVADQKKLNPAFIYAVLLWPIFDSMNIPAEEVIFEIINKQNTIILIPKRYSHVIRDIWVLQKKLVTKKNMDSLKALEHDNFRAGFDFLALRAMLDDKLKKPVSFWEMVQKEIKNY
jgi:poly(A) polymerase